MRREPLGGDGVSWPVVSPGRMDRRIASRTSATTRPTRFIPARSFGDSMDMVESSIGARL